MLLLHCNTVFPVSSPPIRDGAVAVHNGMIADCGPFSRIRKQYAYGEVLDLTDCALLPGFVNAHTHLEFSALKGQVPYHGDFVDWVRRLRALHVGSPAGPPDQTLAEACRQSLTAGVTTVGDVCHGHDLLAHPAASAIRRTSFAEVFGMTAQLDDPINDLARTIDQSQTNSLVRLGISPHAPYSASDRLYERTAQLAESHNLAMTTHLAENPAETEFIQTGAGPWLRYLAQIGKWDGSFACPRSEPVNYFLQLDLAGRPFALAHVNYIDTQDLRSLAQTDHSVVYCPRSHDFFGHPPHAFKRMLRHGINVCLGTDSLASSDSLSILDEMRHLHRQDPDFSTELLLRMATINGAVALGWHDKTGSISCGKEADLTAIPLTNGPATAEPLDDILKSTSQPKLTMVRGIERHRTT